MRDCESIRESLSGYIDGVLPEAESARVEAHLRECPGCEAELEGMRSVIAMMVAMERVDPPAGLVERVEGRIARETTFGGALRRLARKVFLPLQVKLPFEIAGVVAAAVLIVWMAGHLGRGGIERMTPDSPAVSETGKAPPGEEVSRKGPSGGSDGPSGQAATESAGREEVPAGDEGQVSKEETAAGAEGRVSDEEAPLAAARQAGGDKASVGDGGRYAKEDEIAAPPGEPGPLDEGRSAGDEVKMEFEEPAGAGSMRQQQPPEPAPAALEEKRLAGLEALVDSLGGRFLSEGPANGAWREPEEVTAGRERTAVSFSASRADAREKDAKGIERARAMTTGAAGPGVGLLYLVIPRSAAASFFEALSADGTVDVKAMEHSTDSLLVRIRMPDRR